MPKFSAVAKKVLDTIRRTEKVDGLVCVHSMGKVGSYSIYQSVREARCFSVFHTHQLNEDTLERFRGTAAGARVGHVQQSQRFLKSLESAQSVRLITPVRDPLSRNVSAFFENLDRFDVEETSKDVNLAIRTFIERYPHTLPIRWFEQQMAQPLGVDALKAEPGKPYLFPDTPFELLILRAEDPDEDKEEALREFLEYPTLRLSLANVSENKPYAELYSAFKREFRPPPEMVDMLFDAPYVQRFYSPEERHRMKDRWNRPGPR